MNGKSKSVLGALFHTHHVSDSQMMYHREEDDREFSYEFIRFQFDCLSWREIEKLTLIADIPVSELKIKSPEELSKCPLDCSVPLEHYFLSKFSHELNEMSRENQNINKDIREKASFEAQCVNQIMMKRNGAMCIIHPVRKDRILRIKIRFTVPLLKGYTVNANAFFKGIKSNLELICEKVRQFDADDFAEYEKVYSRQKQIRQYLSENSLLAFIADGSILPRENGTDKPMSGAIPFLSPESLKRTVTFSDGTLLSGMGIPQGVCVITGGGYSGKSTLLDAVEMGVYNHVPNDGREYVVTDETALKIYAEDGRPVHNLDMSPFFKYIPKYENLKNFSTLHASGSVSQAANIIEAVNAGSRLLLIDEDRSATNFMIRDKNMRQIIPDEPIIPFTDRIQDLYRDKKVSTILVIGGSSEYLSYADTVILMRDYAASDITERISSLELPSQVSEEKPAGWANTRYLRVPQLNKPFMFFRSVSTENMKKIVLDEFSSDITLLTTLITDGQLNTLAYMMEQLLTDKKCTLSPITDVIRNLYEKGTENEGIDITAPVSFKTSRWYEAVRPIDILCCISRMRGISFTL